jgi:hypothetical protein
VRVASENNPAVFSWFVFMEGRFFLNRSAGRSIK